MSRERLKVSFNSFVEILAEICIFLKVFGLCLWVMICQCRICVENLQFGICVKRPIRFVVSRCGRPYTMRLAVAH